jgi:hypothetical protein
MIAVFVSGTMSCAPILHVNFDADEVGQIPSVSPAGMPNDDRLALQGQPDSITVIYSDPLNSKAVKLDRMTAPPATIFEGISGGGIHNVGVYYVCFKSYPIADQTVLSISIQSHLRKMALRLTYQNSTYIIASGEGKETFPGTYPPLQTHVFCFKVDMNARRFSLSVDDIWKITDRSFLDADFSDLHLIRFEYTAAILEGFSGIYVVDEITIMKRIRPCIWID